MSQTEKSYTDVQSILADNVLAAISPQDLRDALASCMGYGGLVLSVAGAPDTMVGVDTDYSLVDIFNVVTAQSSDVNVGGTVCTLSPTYDITFATTGIYRVDFWASFSAAAGNTLVTFRPHIDGVAGLVEVDRDVAANDTGSVSFSGIIPYTAGQTIDVRVKIDAGSTTLTFLAAGFSGFRVG